MRFRKVTTERARCHITQNSGRVDFLLNSSILPLTTKSVVIAQGAITSITITTITIIVIVVVLVVVLVLVLVIIVVVLL